MWQNIAPVVFWKQELVQRCSSHRQAKKQGRTQEGADGAKAPPPPEIKKIIIFTHSNTEHFMFCSLYKEVSFTIVFID